MWLLKKLNEGVTKYLISENKSYTVGRKNCNFTIEDDASISRKHCTIYVAKQSECPVPVKTITGVWLVDEQSKYGTYIKNNNDWLKINSNENKKLPNGSIIKFGLMDNIWSLEFKPIVACASGIPVEQKKNIESTLTSIDGFLRNTWCKECSLVVVNEITLTVKVVLALINGIPIVTPNYVQKLVECVKNNLSLPNYEEYRPVIKESILDKSLVSLDTKNNRKQLFKDIKFVIPTKKQLETLKEVITSAGGSIELLSSSGKLERFAEDNVVVIQLPVNNNGIPEDLCKLFKEISVFLKKNFGKRVIPESEIAQAVAYSSTEKFCNPKSTCFNLKIGEPKQVDLGPVIVEETPFAADDTKHSGLGVVASSETVEAELSLGIPVAPETPKTTELHSSDKQTCGAERKRTHSPNQVDHEFQKKRARSKVLSNDYNNLPAEDVNLLDDPQPTTKQQMRGKSNPNKTDQTKPSYITNYFQKQNKPPTEVQPDCIKQTSSSFWSCNTVGNKFLKRKISIESDDSLENSNSCVQKKRPLLDVSKPRTPGLEIDTPREVVEVLGSKNSRDSVSVSSIRKVVAEDNDDQTGYFGRDVSDDADLQVDELNNTIFSLTIISPAFMKADGTLIDPPSMPVNVKRFRKQKIISSAILSSLEERDDELSDGDWIEPHSDHLNISVANEDD